MHYSDLDKLPPAERLLAFQASPAGLALAAKGFYAELGGGFFHQREEQDGSLTCVLATGEDHGPLEMEEPASVYVGHDPSDPTDFPTLAAYLATL